VRAHPDRHELVSGVRQHFDAGRLSETGYLRPLKRNLVDIFVSQPTLSYALDTANDLFLLLEQRGHRVGLASGPEHVHRPELSVYEGQKFDYHNREPWTPGRATLVWIDSVAFGLTLFESTDHVDVTYEWDRPVRYVRTTSDTKPRSTWSIANTTYKQHLPSGRLTVRAYCPYGGVTWERRWSENQVGALSKKLRTIAGELLAAVPDVVRLRREANTRAEVERQKWEAQRLERERQEQARRRAEALSESRQQLLSIVESWSLARNIESFFEDVERSTSGLASDERAVVLDRLAKARALLGGTDALARVRQWKAPDER
jgi:hypothetical protein